MSDNPSKSDMKKTSAVPLRKETVRVTLKANPVNPGTAPVAPPAPTGISAPPAPVGMSAPPAPAPSVPLSPSSPVPAPPAAAATAPLGATSGTPSAIPAPPTVALQVNEGANTPAPAPTIQLKTGGGALPMAGATSQPLPRATVQLQQTQPMESPESKASVNMVDYEDLDEKSGGGFINVLSIAAVVLALMALAFQLMTTSVWVDGEWGKLFE